MTSEQTYIQNDGTGMQKALATADKLAAEGNLSRREAFRLRLLVEETLGMVRAITGAFHALFWIEYDEEGNYEIRLEAKTSMAPEKKEDLIAVSSTGKNEATRGIMGKIRGVFENALWDYQEAERLQMEYGMGPVAYGAMGIDSSNSISQAVTTWSLQKYRQNVAAARDSGDNQLDSEVWDELEKSIVANIADEIKVGIRKDTVDMTIYKSF